MFYPLIHVLSPHPCFIPSSMFYPLIHVLSPHPCFIPSSMFYPLIHVLSPHPCFIPSSVFYPHPCFIQFTGFIPSSVFNLRVLSPQPSFTPSSVFVSVSVIRTRIRVLSEPARGRHNETMNYSPVNNEKKTRVPIHVHDLWTAENCERFELKIDLFYRIKFNGF